MPSGSTVVIKYDGTDITRYILWPSARFESQLNAVPGTWEFTVKDVNHSFNFVTGKEVTGTIDGVSMLGGYLLQVQRTYPFPAMDTVNRTPASTARFFTLRGVDYNILFDKRVLRNAGDYLHQIPNFSGTTMDGALIRLMCSTYLDIPAGFDTTTKVDDIQPPFEFGSAEGAWNQQGDTFRQQMESFTQFTGALYYFDADKKLHHHAIEDTVKSWGFSDKPNGTTKIGPRAIETTQDGAGKVQDALIWGGGQFAGAGGTVFARKTVSPGTGIVSYQLAETHFGEQGFGIQAGVDARANVIVDGPPGAVAADQNRGLKYDQWSIKADWFAHKVPSLDHLRPGYISTWTLEVFEQAGSPLVQLLPLRTMTITFPGLDPTGKGYVKFSGFWGLQPDDPFTLWRFLLKLRGQRVSRVIATVDDNSQGTVYGAWGTFTPTPVPNSSATVFTIPFGYIGGTTNVYRFIAGETGGRLLRRGTGLDYTETDPEAGQITTAIAIPAGDKLLVQCQTLAG